MESSLAGKVTMVTGAGRGIGRAIAEQFAKQKAKIVLVDLDEPTVRATATELQKGTETLPVVADVSKPQDVTRLIKEATSTFGTIDILVNNAGILRDASLLKLTEGNFDAVIAVNLKGVFLCGQAAAKVMAQKKYGKIINISSIAWQGNFGQTNYSASKAGVVAMTKTWALELSRFGINVNAVAPGLVSTEMTRTIPPEIKEKMIKQIPLGRPGEPQDVANLVCFLASDRASYIQGEVIGINGGFRL